LLIGKSVIGHTSIMGNFPGRSPSADRKRRLLSLQTHRKS
jgi:hypothetical protein